MKSTDEKIERLEQKVVEQQKCLRDKDRRIFIVEKKVKNIKKTHGTILLVVPFIFLVALTIYGFVSTAGVFDMVSYDTSFNHNPQVLPFALYTFATVMAEIVLCGFLYNVFILKEND